MIFYLLLCSVVFLFVLLFEKASKGNWSYIKISLITFLSSVAVLMLWNFCVGPLVFYDSLDNGVSVILRSALSIALIFSYSLVLCGLLYIYRQMLD